MNKRLNAILIVFMIIIIQSSCSFSSVQENNTGFTIVDEKNTNTDYDNEYLDVAEHLDETDIVLEQSFNNYVYAPEEYLDNYKIIQENNIYYIENNGNKSVPIASYDDFGNVGFDKNTNLKKVGYVALNENGQIIYPGYGKYGYINVDGEEVIPAIHNQIGQMTGEGEDAFVTAQIDNKWGLVDKDYNILVNFDYDELYMLRKSLEGGYLADKWHTYIVVSKDGKEGIIDLSENTILPIEYDGIATIVVNDQAEIEYYIVLDFLRWVFENASASEYILDYYVDYRYSILDKDGTKVYSSPIMRTTDYDNIPNNFYSKTHDIKIYDINFAENKTVNINGYYGPFPKRTLGNIVPTISPGWIKYENEPEYEVLVIDENTPYELKTISELID